MQIQRKVLRLAAAAGVSMFLAVGAVGPVYATDSGQPEETTSQQTAPESESEESQDDSEIPNEPRNQLGYEKPDELDKSSGNETFDWGSLEWGGQTMKYVVNGDYEVDLCIKSGSQVGTKEYLGLAGPIEGAESIDQEISHVGYRVVDRPAEETPEEETPEEETPEEETPEEETPGEVTPGDEDGEETGEQPGEAEEECPTEGDMPAEVPAGGEGAEEVPASGCVTVTPETPEDVVVDEAPSNAANRAPAEVANTAGVLPATGAGRYALPVIAGLALLGAGGVLLLRKRSRADS